MNPITIHLYRTPVRRQWRWRAVAPNGRKLAHGGESYHNRSDAYRAICNLFRDQPIQLAREGETSIQVLR